MYKNYISTFLYRHWFNLFSRL
uniref:Uncharacterized protein n=1 Tax=Anguilla anguilla TaxID=7936 RepID=A0A0E9T8C4_ANGAN